MSIDAFFTHASTVMTVVSFAVFLGILWWTYIANRREDFSEAAQLPFADEAVDERDAAQTGARHV